MPDCLARATAEGVKIYAIETTRLVEEACARHSCWPLAAAALGRTMTGALLLTASLKGEDRVTIKIDGDGPLGSIVADAGNDTVRGYVDNPQADLPARNGKIDVAGGVGKGKIIVTRFTGLKTPFTGWADLVSGEIAADLTNYLYVSEQTPASIALGVLVGTDGKVKAAGGFFVQAMPGADEAVLQKLEENIDSLPPVTVMLENGANAEDIVKKIAGDTVQLTIHDKLPVKFKCTCSPERILDMLAGLSDEDFEAVAQDQETEVRCHFCNNKYTFSQKEILQMKNT